MRKDTLTRQSRLRRLIIPAALFATFAAALLFQPQWISAFGLDTRERPFTILDYAIHIGFWIAAAGATGRALRVFVWEGFIARTTGRPAPRLLGDVVTLGLYAVAVTIIVGGVFEKPLTGFWATSGVFGIVLGLAMRNMILDLFTGVAINIDQPYIVGDWVKVHERHPEMSVIGQIEEMNWRTTRIRTEENSLVVVPNSVFGLSTVTNFDRFGNAVRYEASINLDFSVPVERARRILSAAATAVTESPGFASDPAPEVLIEETDESGTRYTVRYWIRPWKGTSPSRAKDTVTSAILEHLRHAGLQPAYPKEDVYFEKMPQRQFDSRSEDDRVELFGRLQIFEPLQHQDLVELARDAESNRIEAGERLIEAGAAGDSMYVIVEGLLDVWSPGSDDEQRRIARVGPGKCLGEMSLLTGAPRSATVIAATDVLLHEVNRNSMESLFRRKPELADAIAAVMVRRQERNRDSREPGARLGETSTEEGRHLVRRIRSFFASAFGKRASS